MCWVWELAPVVPGLPVTVYANGGLPFKSYPRVITHICATPGTAIWGVCDLVGMREAIEL